eukprot:GHRR01004668.1.p1 GENE.GHRR01004668.1~~GHRR01004668.1.p1  ORF type:complete len:276 (+),score=125.16 GHRR01004668.1:785-1612(+)
MGDEVPIVTASAQAGDCDKQAKAQQAGVSTDTDPLPSPEQIAKANAAAGAGRPHSLKEDSSGPPLKGLGKGLGGAGLGPKRGKSKGGTGSTISAATAPPALTARTSSSGLGKQSKTGDAVPSSFEEAAGSSIGSPTAAGKGPQKQQQQKGKGAGKAAAGGKKSAGSQKPSSSSDASKTAVAKEVPVTDIDEGGSGDWESVSSNEEGILESILSGDAGSTIKPASTGSSSSSSGTWQDSLLDMFDHPVLVLCGAVLGLCTGSLLVLGGRAWISRAS